MSNSKAHVQISIALRRENKMLDSKALTKIQSAIVVIVIIVAALGGALAYLLAGGQNRPVETIKIGVLADLDASLGTHIWQGAVLAAEQLNAEGGVLGRQIELVGEDSDDETDMDGAKVSLALTRLITYHKVDYVIGADLVGSAVQDVIAVHKKVFIGCLGSLEENTQRVLDDYEKYKYYFRVWAFNQTSIFQGITDSLLQLREQAGFNKIGILAQDISAAIGIKTKLENVLANVHGFEIVYGGSFPPGTSEFSSYFAAIEEAGTEVLVPLISFDEGIPFAKEWFDRQSPTLVYSGYLLLVSQPESWEWTDGKCEYMSVATTPIAAGFPWTSKTLPAREAYMARWGKTPHNVGAAAYDTLRFILSDAIERAGTFETNAVIDALEETSIETSNARNFVFTSSHDVMMGENPNDPDADYMLMMLFQWQNGELVPVYPKKIMEEAGATYTFPDWPGPWDK